MSCIWDEDFTGSSFDSDLWTEYDPYGVLNCVNNYSFASNVYSPRQSASLSSNGKNWNVSDNFNVQLNIIFGIYGGAYPAMQYNASFYLYHYVDANNYAIIHFTRGSGWQGGFTVGYSIETAGALLYYSVDLGQSAYDYDYKLKIIRTGSTFQFYYWKNGVWYQIGNDVITQYTSSGYLTLYSYGSTVSTVMNAWTVDNLVFNSGCPTSTSTSSTSSSTSSTSTSSTSSSTSSTSTSSTSSSTSSTSTSSTSSSTSSTSSSSSSTSTSSSISTSSSTSTTTIMDFRKAKLSRQLDKSYLKISKYR